ncbi:MAG: hypothetical protein U1E65_13800 [Myxococcota bacterium]
MVRPQGGGGADRPQPTSAQLDIIKASIAASAEITAAMVKVTNEKNPAKICEAFKVIYKAVQEAVKGA